MKFQLFRYLLSPAQSGLYSSKELGLSREGVMKKILEENVDFQNLAREFSYRHVKTVNNQYIIGYMGRKALVEHELKVSNSFIRKKEEEWPYRTIIIDTAPDSQIVAFQEFKKNEFNSPNLVLGEYSKKLNESLPDYGWHIEFEAITSEEAFWTFVQKHEGQIVSLHFSLNVPNLFGTDDELNRELEQAKREFLAQKVETEIKNFEGDLKIPENRFVRESVELVKKGGGSYKIKLKNKTTYKSQSDVRTINIKEAEIATENEEVLLAIINEIFT
jgi:hypothetical protein